MTTLGKGVTAPEASKRTERKSFPAKPVKGEVDVAKLTKKTMARYPKVIERLAK
ncbi:MAG: hypothetical protein K2X62_08405 [Beijerinckiaceae bacterium]|jgi:hypothetical protein|nr:hypothetical protein [Beijerinckiaceae bacterium]